MSRPHSFSVAPPLTSFIVAALGCSGPAAPDDTTGESALVTASPAMAPPSVGLAALPDGTYRIPTIAWIPARNCSERFDLVTVGKHGGALTVTGPFVSSSPLQATGDVTDGHFHGSVTHCPWCSGPKTTHTMDGTLSYGAGGLEVSLRITDGGYFNRRWTGAITTTVFGQDESTLPAGAKRATLALGPRTDGCGSLWQVTIVKLADGTRLLSLPDYSGDVALPDGVSPRFSCARGPVFSGARAGSIDVHAVWGESTCFDTAPAPLWFTE